MRKAGKQPRAALLWSAGIAVGLSILSYVLNNQPLLTGEDMDQYAWMEWVKTKLPAKTSEDNTQPLYINVAYDKQLIECRDEYDMPIGNTDITDRRKLLALLQMLRTTGQYKYVFLDVRFEKGHETETDSALFAEISRMDRLVVAAHSDVEPADMLPVRKAAVSDYAATVTTNFVRYEFLQDGRPSMALHAYSEITGKTISKHGLLYTCGGSPCYNSLFVRFPVEALDEAYGQDKNVYNLGVDILDNYDDSDLAVLTKDKYIVIGDFVEDVHDTYAGSRPGPVITFYAFRALMAGEQMVSCGITLFFLAVYFCISLSLFSRHSWIERMPYIGKSKTAYFCLSLLGYGTVLSLITIVLNVFWNITTSIFLPSVCFAIQALIINYKRTKI